MDVNDSCRLCFGNLRIDGKLRVLASWEQHSAGVLRHRHERPPPFAPTNLSLLWLARTRSYRCKHSTEDKGQTIGVEPSLAEARRMAREAKILARCARKRWPHSGSESQYLHTSQPQRVSCLDFTIWLLLSGGLHHLVVTVWWTSPSGCYCLVDFTI